MSKKITTNTAVYDLKQYKKIHFVGIGGSSMHGLAEFALDQGKAVSGSDMNDSDILDGLRTMGAQIHVPHSSKFIAEQTPDAVVYTVAVSDDNPEIVYARENQIPLIDRSVFLGLIMKMYNRGICVAGTHGKTSTTSMISSILYENNADPAIHIGGVLPLIGGNNHIGTGECFVTEACEYHKSFLNFKTDIGVILNVEHDHVDFFPTFEEYKDAFKEFVATIPTEGYVVICADDLDCLEVVKDAKCTVVSYGLTADADWTAENLYYDKKGCGVFDVVDRKSLGGIVCHVHLSVPGQHNVLNALASVATASLVGIDGEACETPLHGFGGANRRFQLKGEENGICVYDDYAHHPTEIRTTLDGVCKYKEKNQTWCVFQPHTYSRTKGLFDLFKTSFNDVGQVVITDIYAAREKDPGDIKASDLAEAINHSGGNAIYIKSFDEIADYFAANTKPGDVVLTIGAGDVTKIGPMVLERLKAGKNE